MKIDKINMRQLSRYFSNLTDRKVTFIEFDGTRLHFGIEEGWTLKTIDIDGNVTPARRVSHGGYPRYFNCACYPCQVLDGDLEFLIKNNMTQNVHERFAA